MTGNLFIIRCLITSGMRLILKFSEFRTDDKFLVVTLLDTTNDLSIDAEAL